MAPGGLASLGQLGRLAELILWEGPVLGPERWQEVAGLPSLTSLAIDEEDLYQWPDGLVMPKIEELRLAHGDLPPLERIPEAFPSLRALALSGHQEDPVDISALTSLERLTSLSSEGTVSGTERLSPDVRVHFSD